jgi:hypothetical protein
VFKGAELLQGYFSNVKLPTSFMHPTTHCHCHVSVADIA